MKTIGPENASIKTLMIVDNDEIDHQLAEITIRRSNLVHKIVPFLDTYEALDYLSGHSSDIDVMLVDIHMPLMDGFEFLQAAGERLDGKLADIIVAMISTTLDPKEIDLAKNHPAVSDFFSKPLSVNHLNIFANRLKQRLAS